MDRARYKRLADEDRAAFDAKKNVLREKFGQNFITAKPLDQFMLFTNHLSKLTLEEVILITDQLEEFSLERFLETPLSPSVSNSIERVDQVYDRVGHRAVWLKCFGVFVKNLAYPVNDHRSPILDVPQGLA